MSLTSIAPSTLTQIVILAFVPFLIYQRYHRLRHSRSSVAVAKRVGLCVGQPVYILYAAIIGLATIALLVLWKPALEPFYREGMALEAFAGAELTTTSIVAALLYGFFQTGFTEEFLFRGLITGSLARRLSVSLANIAWQSCGCRVSCRHEAFHCFPG